MVEIDSSAYHHWITENKKNISFRYPPDWKAHQSAFGEGKIYGLNPSSINDNSTYFIFEIIELPSKQIPFSEARKEMFNFYDKRTSEKIEKLSKQSIVWKGLDADVLEFQLKKEDSVTLSVTQYNINGIKNYYIISVSNDLPEYKYGFDSINKWILNSISITP